MINDNVLNFGIMVVSCYHSIQIINMMNDYKYEDVLSGKGSASYLFINILSGASVGLYFATALKLIQNVNTCVNT